MSDNNFDNKLPIINQILTLFDKVKEQHSSEEDEEKRWLVKNCANKELLSIFDEMTVMMIHVLDAIGKYEPVNTITISKNANFPKGTVSKIARKLVDKGLIAKEAIPNNKKESLFCLTPLGRELFHLHLELHKRMDFGIKKFLNKYSEDELKFVSKLLEDFSEVSWIDEENL